jgi:hypothetical protein
MMAISKKPKLRYEKIIRRSLFFRRFAWSVLGAVAGVGAWAALEEAASRGLVDGNLLLVGRVVSLIVFALFALRALVSLWRGFRRRSETLRLFDKGLLWTTPKQTYKYSWSQLEAYREGGHGLYLGKKPILQWGALRLKMADGQVFRITGAYGNLREINAIIRRYAAHFTGIQIGRLLREEQPVRLHRRLTVWPGGIEAGKHEIPWSEVEVSLRNGRLSILQKNKKGKFQTVRRYNAGNVDNVGGFMELAKSTIRNHQRERFEKAPVVDDRHYEAAPQPARARSFHKGD